MPANAILFLYKAQMLIEGVVCLEVLENTEFSLLKAAPATKLLINHFLRQRKNGGLFGFRRAFRFFDIFLLFFGGD
jgi:hypothetical protein